MQRLNVELSIEIPADYVLITKVEFEELKSDELHGFYWDMKDLETRTGRKQYWLKEHILYPSKNRSELDSENGGFVFYPHAYGQPWAFQAAKMAAFLDQNFPRIFKVSR